MNISIAFAIPRVRYTRPELKHEMLKLPLHISRKIISRVSRCPKMLFDASSPATLISAVTLSVTWCLLAHSSLCLSVLI